MDAIKTTIAQALDEQMYHEAMVHHAHTEAGAAQSVPYWPAQQRGGSPDLGELGSLSAPSSRTLTVL